MRSQPDIVVAVTGTNGKTSVASFVRQIWSVLGLPAASVGTVGIVSPSGTRKLAHTTPDPVEIHRALKALSAEHVSHVALEASSHGLAQYRLNGVHVAAAGFTNLTRDHLDYHKTFEAYLDAKMMLFEQVLGEGALPSSTPTCPMHKPSLSGARRARWWCRRSVPAGSRPCRSCRPNRKASASSCISRAVMASTRYTCRWLAASRPTTR
jgi:hypothetical protein